MASVISYYFQQVPLVGFRVSEAAAEQHTVRYRGDSASERPQTDFPLTSIQAGLAVLTLLLSLPLQCERRDGRRVWNSRSMKRCQTAIRNFHRLADLASWAWLKPLAVHAVAPRLQGPRRHPTRQTSRTPES